MRTILIGAAALLVAAVAGLWAGRFLGAPNDAQPAQIESRPAIRDFSLTGADNQKVSLSTYRGKWVLMFFGFTMCPEACPLAMQLVTATLEDMGEEGRAIKPIFVSIDPERDTPAVLKEYLGHFSDDIDGLSGTAEETADIAKQYGVFYRKRPIGEDYTMDHSTALYLIAPDGEYVRPFRADVDPAELAEDLAASMTEWKKRKQ